MPSGTYITKELESQIVNQIKLGYLHQNIAKNFNINPHTVTKIKKRNGLFPQSKQLKIWTSEEDEFIIKHFSENTSFFLNNLKGRTKSAIGYRRHILRDKSQKSNTPFSQEEDKILQNVYPEKGAKECSLLLNRSISSVNHRVIRLKIKRKYGTENRIRKNCVSWAGYGELSGEYFNNIKYGAIARNLEFNITIEQIWELFLKQNRKCILSGVGLKFNSYSRVNDGTASLDRIDSSKGYIEGNVQWVHKAVNYMKWDKTDKDFIKWCDIISEYNKQKLIKHQTDAA